MTSLLIKSVNSLIFVQKANRLIGLIKKSFEFLDAPSSVMNLIHQSSLSSF